MLSARDRKLWAKEEVFDALSEWLANYFIDHPNLDFDDREALSEQVKRAQKPVDVTVVDKK